MCFFLNAASGGIPFLEGDRYDSHSSFFRAESRNLRGAMLLLMGCLLAGLLAGCGGGSSAVSANSKGVIYGDNRAANTGAAPADKTTRGLVVAE